MDEYARQKKQIRNDGTAAKRRRSQVSRGLPAGTLKGKEQVDNRPGPKKPSVAAARRTGSSAEHLITRRKELSLPMETSDVRNRAEHRSMRLTLRVEGPRIRIVNSIEVDAPAQELHPVRGTHFLEVRVGNQVLALEPLVDPGLAIGIPDRRDDSEFRGHRKVLMPFYDVAVLVPVDALESTRAIESHVEATVYAATENLELDPVRTDATREGRRRLARVATTGRLTADEVRSVSRPERHKPEPLR